MAGSDCSASRVLSYYITRRATKEDLQLKTCHHRNCTCEILTTISWTAKEIVYKRQSKNDNKIRHSHPTMHCFTTAPFRKLVFQKGTEPSCTSSTLLVKGKGVWGTMRPPLIASSFDIFLTPPPTLWIFPFFFPTEMEKKVTRTCSFSEENSFC